MTSFTLFISCDPAEVRVFVKVIRRPMTTKLSTFYATKEYLRKKRSFSEFRKVKIKIMFAVVCSDDGEVSTENGIF